MLRNNARKINAPQQRAVRSLKETAERNVTESVEREVGWRIVEKVVVRRRRYWCDGGGRGGMEDKDEIKSLS
ncbi:hypothetical protein Tco_0998113 [Tanacetum coccineum]